MDFNDIGKKISTVGNSVVNKAKNASMINDLKNRITQEEKAIDGYFLSLGKQYYNLKKDEPDEEIKSLIDMINEGYERIEELQKQCSILQNTKTCRGCGAVLEPDALFCIQCGLRVEEEKPEVPPITPDGRKPCIYCGALLPEFAAFCNKCGKPQ